MLKTMKAIILTFTLTCAALAQAQPFQLTEDPLEVCALIGQAGQQSWVCRRREEVQRWFSQVTEKEDSCRAQLAQMLRQVQSRWFGTDTAVLGSCNSTRCTDADVELITQDRVLKAEINALLKECP